MSKKGSDTPDSRTRSAKKRRKGEGRRPDPLAEYRRRRDFSRTAEPSGAAGSPTAPEEGLQYVMQKHDARNLHFDLRLELDGVMKSWAVPKGPSLDPEVRRLAVHVEDHPLDYNSFEGTIAKGEYGAGSVMVWDRGSYRAPERTPGASPPGRSGGRPERGVPGATGAASGAEASIRRGYAAGRLSFVLDGERLKGLFHLIRTGKAGEGQEQWLLTKGADEFADPRRDVVAEEVNSVMTGRTMEEIEAEEAPTSFLDPPKTAPPPDTGFRPMLAHAAPGLPTGEGWVFEPKYDGIRVLAFTTANSVALITRNGIDKARQFPETAHALRRLASHVERPVVLDGEIVGLRGGDVQRFQALQERMHQTGAARIARHAREDPAAFVAFDLLLEGDEVLFRAPWVERRKRLEALLRDREPDEVRLSEVHRDGESLLARARTEGWEGIIAKRPDAGYEPGRRTRRWLKIKLENRQELVVGGFTEPRGGRRHIGSLLVGYYDVDGRLRFGGHVGSGFSEAALESMHARLERLGRKTSPFETTPNTNQPAHWVTPKVVVEVSFNEWTEEGLLRHPVFLGVREDKDPRDVRREAPAGAQSGPQESDAAVASWEPASADGGGAAALPEEAVRDVLRQIEAIESGRGNGTLDLPGVPGPEGERRRRQLAVTNLNKVFFPDHGYTKGDLMRYYVEVAPYILPVMADRPLVLRRFPHGIAGEAFYQQNASEETPGDVRVEVVGSDEGGAQRRLVGGDLATLLYTVQLGAVSVDPWHARFPSLDFADYTVLDLDPGRETSFARVVEVAKRVKEELDAVDLPAALKTSGATGLHIFVPMPGGTPNEAAQLVAQIIATRVVARVPEIATTERMVRARPKGTVYVDYLQNILGKTVAGAYAVRARPGATVSTPLSWDELAAELKPTDHTIRSVPPRLRERDGDLWSGPLRAPVSLETLLESATDGRRA